MQVSLYVSVYLRELVCVILRAFVNMYCHRHQVVGSLSMCVRFDVYACKCSFVWSGLLEVICKVSKQWYPLNSISELNVVQLHLFITILFLKPYLCTLWLIRTCITQLQYIRYLMFFLTVEFVSFCVFRFLFSTSMGTSLPITLCHFQSKAMTLKPQTLPHYRKMPSFYVNPGVSVLI